MNKKISFKEIKEKYLKDIGMSKLLIIIMAGVLLIIVSLPTKSSSNAQTNASASNSNISNNSDTLDYETYLEQKIEKLLAKVEGVGKVKIMVTLKGTSEKVLVSEDTYSENIVKETDSDGGVRESTQKSNSQAYLYSDTSNGNEPYVAMEIKPDVEGVMIIAEGGGDSKVVTNITKAIEALLSVPTHKIQVLKMQN